MMGHRERLKCGDEFDAFTRWKKFFYWRPGARAAIKRKFWKRARAETRLETRESENT